MPIYCTGDTGQRHEWSNMVTLIGVVVQLAIPSRYVDKLDPENERNLHTAATW